MQRWLLAAFCFSSLVGCGLLEPGRRPGQPLPTRPVGLAKPKPKSPAETTDPSTPGADWTLGPGPRTPRPGSSPGIGLPGLGIPKSNPTQDYGNLTKDRRELLGGLVEDAQGKPAARVMVEYVAADGTDGPGAILDTLTDEQGRFLIRGLRANTTYILTARATSQGIPLGGRIYARTGAPNAQQLRLQLVEGLEVPAVVLPNPGNRPSDGGRPAAPGRSSGEDLPPRNHPYDTFIPPSNPSRPTLGSPEGLPPGSGVSLPPRERDLPPPRRAEDIRDTDWNPVPSGTGSNPSTNSNPGNPAFPLGTPSLPGNVNLPNNTVPSPAPIFPPSPAPNPLRPELRTDAPKPYYPPVTNIPGTTNRKPPPPTSPEFLLEDLAGEAHEFGTAADRGLTLIEWMTTTCPACRDAVPWLNDWHLRYGRRGLRLLAILQDDVPKGTRRQRARQYQNDYGLRYPIFLEPADRPTGELMDRFQIEAFPTFTLLDAQGRTLWQGSPRQRKQLVEILERELPQP